MLPENTAAAAAAAEFAKRLDKDPNIDTALAILPRGDDMVLFNVP